jgi:hypothetical protein
VPEPSGYVSRVTVPKIPFELLNVVVVVPPSGATTLVQYPEQDPPFQMLL